MPKKQLFALIFALAVVIAVTQSAFIVPETEQALVLQFGDPVAHYTTPGLKFKLPFVQDVMVFDKRVLDVYTPPEEVILADQKRLVVDTFARYKISHMLQFYKSLETEDQANARLDNIINASLRNVLGDVPLSDVLSVKRDDLMAALKKQVGATVGRYGIDIVDIRIVRADLPVQTSEAIYARMRTERQQQAAQFRAEGQEQAQEIKAKADKQRTVLLADAEQQAQVSRGAGDAEASRIYAAAYGRDPAFYAFYRTMQAYRRSFADKDTTLVLSPDSAFLRYFKDEAGKQ
ncbi:MAG: protease modulator HflC [Alphaproteobacteria bacterium]|nr:protease modulator HflC [Alphaproteobacteria bacterium]